MRKELDNHAVKEPQVVNIAKNHMKETKMPTKVSSFHLTSTARVCGFLTRKAKAHDTCEITLWFHSL
jgi:hypothetical protein